MSNDLVTADGDPRDIATAPARDVAPGHNPFARAVGRHINEGTVAVESDRAVAQAQAAFLIAQRFPRDESMCYAKFMEACSRPSFAQSAFFKYSRGGNTIEGPSIRFAEEAGRCWRHFESGMLELSNKDGVTEMQVFAHDLEGNVRSYQNFNVRHIRDTKAGAKDLTDQRDIYEIGANMGSRRLRARILALLPADYVEDGVNRCKETLAKRDGAIPLPDRIKAMLGAFAKANITAGMIAARLGHPIDQCTPQELDDMRAVLTAIKENVTSVADEFPSGGGAPQTAPADGAGSKIAAASAKGNAVKPAETAAKAAAPAETAAKATAPATADKAATPPESAPETANKAEPAPVETKPAAAPAPAQAEPEAETVEEEMF